MRRDDGMRGDVNVILHLLLAIGTVAITATSLGYVVPELFDRHSTSADLVALCIAAGSLAFAYVAGRFVWRSFQITTSEREE